jgi:hypothetical protein
MEDNHNKNKMHFMVKSTQGMRQIRARVKGEAKHEMDF